MQDTLKTIMNTILGHLTEKSIETLKHNEIPGPEGHADLWISPLSIHFSLL